MSTPAAEPEQAPSSVGTDVAAALAAANAGTIIGAEGAAAAAPAVAALTAFEATEAVVKAVRAFTKKQERDNYLLLFSTLKREYPQYDDDTLRKLIGEELDREREFSKKMIARIQRDMAAAMKLADPEARRLAVANMLARERRILAMRQEAMIQRAHGAIEIMRLKIESPEGAYWMLSDTVKNHTLDCIALSGNFWPWEVLEALHPPIHPGCACYLLSLHEAIQRGFMRLSMIPDKKDAIRHARAIMREARRMEQAASPAQIAAHLELLEAGHVDPGFLRRFPKGTKEGGRFMPRRGGLTHPIEHKLRLLLPGRMTPAERRAMGTGRWRWAGTRKLFIPEQQHFDRVLDGHHYTSPLGSTNLYRDGKFVARDRRDPGTPAPLFKPPTEDQHLAEIVRQQAEKTPDGPLTPEVIGRSPRTWNEYAQETAALAQRLAHRYDAPVVYKGIEYDAKTQDHAGRTDWDGHVFVGYDVMPSILYDDYLQREHKKADWNALRSTFGSYKVQAHEVTHAVNPISADDFTDPTARALEEALAEEESHQITVENLRRDNRDDVLQWVKQNPYDDKVQGSYLGYRAALGDVLTDAGIARSEFPTVIENLKFRVPPHLREEVLAEYAKANGKDYTEAGIKSALTAAIAHHAGDTKIEPLIPWGLEDLADENLSMSVKGGRVGLGAEITFLGSDDKNHTNVISHFVRASGDDWAGQTVDGDWIGPANFREVVTSAPETATAANEVVRESRSLHRVLTRAIKGIRLDEPLDHGTPEDHGTPDFPISGRDVPFTPEIKAALQRVRDERAKHQALVDKADAAFKRYFEKRQAGTPTSGAAWQRLENNANYYNVDHVIPAESDAYDLLSAHGGSWDLDAALKADETGRNDPGTDPEHGYKVMVNAQMNSARDAKAAGDLLAKAHADGHAASVRIRARDSLTRDRVLTAEEQQRIVDHAAAQIARQDPGTLYHVSERKYRDAIQKEGLKGSAPDLPGVHFWDSLDAAQAYARRLPADVYEVDAHGLDLRAPKDPYPGKGRHLVHDGPVPPERLKLVAERPTGTVANPSAWADVPEREDPGTGPLTREHAQEWMKGAAWSGFMYHGTTQASADTLTGQGAHEGTLFTTDKRYAALAWADTTAALEPDAPRVAVPVAVRFDKPLVLTNDGTAPPGLSWGDFEIMSRDTTADGEPLPPGGPYERARAAGYDGVVAPEGTLREDETVAVALGPNSVRVVAPERADPGTATTTWMPGGPGKGWVWPDGRVVVWPVDGWGQPQHLSPDAPARPESGEKASSVVIDEDGTVHDPSFRGYPDAPTPEVMRALRAALGSEVNARQGRGVEEAKFDERLHPRARGGRWAKKLTEKSVTGIYDGFEHGGLKTRVDRHSSSPYEVGGKVQVSGQIERKGKSVGVFSRTIEDRGDGTRTAFHDTMKLDPQERGKGFGHAFNQHAEKAYVENGISKITLTAADEVGGYAWARAGYKFARMDGSLDELSSGADQAGSLMRTAEETVDRLVEQGKVSQDQADAFWSHQAGPDDVIAYERAKDPSFEAKIEDATASAKKIGLDVPRWPEPNGKALDGKFSTPQEIAAFGHEHTWDDGGRQTWLGKEVMLASRWDGEKALNVQRNYRLGMRPGDEFDPFKGKDIPEPIAVAIRTSEPDQIRALPPEEEGQQVGDVIDGVMSDPSLREQFTKDGDEILGDWKKDADPKKWTPPKGVVYSAEVAKINTPDDAIAYLKTRGVEADLKPPDTEQGRVIAKDADFFRQIAQAVTDAQDRNPILVKGQHPFKHVAFWSNLRNSKESGYQDLDNEFMVWGTTAIDITDFEKNPGMIPMPSYADESLNTPEGLVPRERWENDPTGVVLSDINSDLLSRDMDMAKANKASLANMTPYGRMTHELGHAVFAAGDNDWKLQQKGSAQEVADLLDGAGLTPHEVAKFSLYGASSWPESLAEIYTTLYTPGVLNTLPKALQTKLRKYEKHAKEAGLL